ncbi:MAG TPA: hypothetical protein VFQ86_08125 [Arachidicoccus soli]|nr:hypothetical protein [Arachidicoccus soli]
MQYDSTLAKNKISLQGDGFELSTALYNVIASKFIFGGTISKEMSEKTFQFQRASNKIGGGFNLGIEYRSAHPIFKKNKEWSWMIDVSENGHFSGDYSDNVFGLLFLGNAHFLGETIEISGTYGRYEQFLSIGGGIHNRKTKSFITINAIFPQNFFNLAIDKGDIGFSNTGDEWNLNAEGTLLSANSYAYFKGLGAALNFGVYLPFGKGKKFNGIIEITGRNLGFYELNKANYYTVHTHKLYSGFSIKDLVNNVDDINLMDTLGISKREKTRGYLLPGFVQVGKIVMADSAKRWQSFFGLRFYTTKVYRPMIYAGVNFQPVSTVSIGTQLSYGGYGDLRLGLYVNYFTKRWNVGIGTEDLLGALMKYQFGYSGLIRASWTF